MVHLLEANPGKCFACPEEREVSLGGEEEEEAVRQGGKSEETPLQAAFV